jgi:type 1 glutamine amidotransferase
LLSIAAAIELRRCIHTLNDPNPLEVLPMVRWRHGLFLLPVVALLSLLGAGDAAPREEKVKPIRALLVTGGPYHDYEKQKDILTKGIAARAPVEWTIAYDHAMKDIGQAQKHLNPVFEKPDWAKGYDVVAHDECCSQVTDESIIARILEPHRQGLPAVVLHCGMHSFRSAGWPKMTPWFEFTGLPSTGHGPQLPIDITFTDKESPITKGLSDWTTGNEELYNNSAGKLLDTAHPLARGKQVVKKGGKERTDDFVVVWTNLYKGKGRVFATTLGHQNVTVADGRYLDLVTRGLLWAVDKLDDAHLKAGEK